MKNTNSTVCNGKMIPVKKRPEDALHAADTITLLNAGDPGMLTNLMHSQDFTLVLNKFKIDTWLVESVKSDVDAILPYLLQDRDYKWQELLGEDYLADMIMPRHLATLCLKHLATLPDAALIDRSYPGCDTSFFQVAS